MFFGIIAQVIKGVILQYGIKKLHITFASDIPSGWRVRQNPNFHNSLPVRLSIPDV
jgi:hypothetical protein